MHALASETGSNGAQIFRDPGFEWFLEAQLYEVDGSTGEQRSPAGESLLIVLDGTFDLAAGGGVWRRRGLRDDPLAGRPVALFLPPDTPWQAADGKGRILLVSSRQPELPEPETKEEELGRKPLLQISGSNKAFDPVAKDWKPKEAFLSSPEALLPRRFQKISVDGALEADRIAEREYKALSLRADELRVPEGHTATMPELEGPITERLIVAVGAPGARVGEQQLGDAGVAVFAASDWDRNIDTSGGGCTVIHVGAGPKV